MRWVGCVVDRNCRGLRINDHGTIHIASALLDLLDVVSGDANFHGGVSLRLVFLIERCSTVEVVVENTVTLCAVILVVFYREIELG